MDSKENKQQTTKNKTFLQSLKHAMSGVITAYQEERNFSFHLLGLGVVIIAGWLLQVSKVEWIGLLCVSFLVLICEIINTALENMVDLVTKKKFNPIAKKIKDMSAAAVLLSATLAAIVGCLIFLPKIIQLFSR